MLLPSPSYLLRRTPLFLGESLPSFLARLAKVNYYDSSAMIVRLCQERLNVQDNVARPAKAETYQALAELVGVEVSKLYEACAHRFASVVTPPGNEPRFATLPSGANVPLLSSASLQHIRPDADAQFCPLCIRESAYHRLAWVPLAVSACLIHRCLLVQKCPSCWASIRVDDIPEARCPKCNFGLAEAHVTSIDADNLGLLSQAAIQSWLGMESPHGLANRCLVLPNQPSPVLYHVLDGLCWITMCAGENWEYLYEPPGIGHVQIFPCSRREGVTPAKSYVLYATAFKGLNDWPNGFFDFLRAYSLRNGYAGITGVTSKDFSAVRRWISEDGRDSAFQFVREAFSRYADEYTVSFPVSKAHQTRDGSGQDDRPVYITAPGAAGILHTSRRMITRLVAAGRLVGYTPEGDRSMQYRIVRQVEVLQLQREWSEVLPLSEAAKRMRLPEAIVVDLAREGLLNAESGPDVDGSADWTFTARALDECLCEVTECAKEYRALPAQAVGLDIAAQILATVGLGIAKVLRFVADCEIPCYCPPGRPLNLKRLAFRRDDIEAYLEEFRKRNGWVSQAEVMRLVEETTKGMIRADDAVLSSWMDAGLLSPGVEYAGAQCFAWKEIEYLIFGHYFGGEVARGWRVSLDVVEGLVRQGRLKLAARPKAEGVRRCLFNIGELNQLARERSAQ